MLELFSATVQKSLLYGIGGALQVAKFADYWIVTPYEMDFGVQFSSLSYGDGSRRGCGAFNSSDF